MCFVTLDSCFRRNTTAGRSATKSGAVYIMASGSNGTIYIGVTSDLIARTYQHRNGLVEGFAKEHKCKSLVWYETYDDLQEARGRELRMKKWKRAWKIELIERDNPLWKDLWASIAHP